MANQYIKVGRISFKSRQLSYSIASQFKIVILWKHKNFGKVNAKFYILDSSKNIGLLPLGVGDRHKVFFFTMPEVAHGTQGSGHQTEVDRRKIEIL